MNEHKLPIHSIYPKDMLLKPIAFFVFMCIIAFCTSFPSGQGDSFHYGRFLLIMVLSAILIIVVALLFFLFKQKIIIDEQNISFFNVFGKIKKQYKLSGIIDFKWNNQPITSYETSTYNGSALGYNQKTSIKNELIYIIFKNEEIVTLSFDDYENFDEIKQFLFDYCVSNQIIKVIPLEDRRYGTAHRGRRR